ncbi:TPA: hypothetical protein ACNU0J_000988 [Klebsiella pneumoniae]
MVQEIIIKKSNKRGFGGQESFIVTRGKKSYLRIVGNNPHYSLMTVTASEDDKSFYVCRDKIKLISSALQLGTWLNIPPSHETDSSGRKFIRICTIEFIPGKEKEDIEEVREVLEHFFQIYDTCNPGREDVMKDMKEIYSFLSHDDSYDDVYLSDGVWLSSDGKLYDRGR